MSILMKTPKKTKTETVIKKRKNIALLIESSRVYGRDLLRGIAKFAQANDRWQLHHAEHSLDEGIPKWIKKLRPDGLLVRINSQSELQEILKFNIPTVDVRAAHLDPKIPAVDTDSPLIAKMAADHLLERGHHHFAFCGFEGVKYSTERRDCFVDYLKAKGFDVAVYETPVTKVGGSTRAIETAGILVEPSLSKWLDQLPKPVGLMACNDVRGGQVINFCSSQNLIVPEMISIIGVDNDQLICELTQPPMSSVRNGSQLIGFRAAEILQSLIEGRPPTEMLERIPPLDVRVRASTDTLAMDDEFVVQAVTYIREHACDGIDVSDVVAKLPVSRATLERRFHKQTGGTINATINRVRISRIKQLLREPNLKLTAIATMVGFMHPEYMSYFFKREVGITPGQYRKTREK